MIGWRSQAAVRFLFYSAYLLLLLLLWPTPTYAGSGPQPPNWGFRCFDFDQTLFEPSDMPSEMFVFV